MDNLKRKTTKGLIWSFIDFIGTYIIRFIFSVSIARILSPEDYGKIGMIVFFISLGQIFLDSGFGMALINKSNADKKDFSTIFTFKICISFFLYIILLVISNQISIFFQEDSLKKIIKITGLVLIIDSLSSVHVAILTKILNFKKQTLVNIISTIFSGTTGLLLALNGFNVWALVFQSITSSTLRTILYWIFSNWYPTLYFNYSRFKSLFNYGYKVFFQGFTDVIFTKIYYPIIGKFYSTTDLGFFSNANSFSQLLVLQPTIVYGRVLFPALSELKSDLNKIKSVYIKTYNILIISSFFVSTLGILCSYDFVYIFLSEKWLPTVKYIRMFLIEGFFFSMYMLNQNMFNALGRSDYSLKVDILKKVLLMTSLLITIKIGINYVIIGYIIVSFLAFIYSSIRLRFYINIPLNYLILDHLMLIFIILIFFIIDKYLISSLGFENYYKLIIRLITFPIFYLLMLIVLKIKFNKVIMQLIYNKLKKLNYKNI